MQNNSTGRLEMRKWDINYINCEAYGISTKQFLKFKKRYYVLEMKEDGLVIGHAYFYRDAEGDRSIKNLEVRLLEDFIGKGFGTEILECAKEGSSQIYARPVVFVWAVGLSHTADLGKMRVRICQNASRLSLHGKKSAHGLLLLPNIFKMIFSRCAA